MGAVRAAAALGGRLDLRAFSAYTTRLLGGPADMKAKPYGRVGVV